jgi:hypothetical protein
MTLEAAYATLTVYQQWRLGAEIPMLDPKLITMAIDIVLENRLKQQLETMTQQTQTEWLKARALNRAIHYYTEAYKRWALELSHDKNTDIAKSIAVFIVSELHIQTDDEFWTEVRKLIVETKHTELYKP